MAFSFTFFLFLVSMGPLDFVRRLTAESGFVENVSAIAYLGAFIVCVYRLFGNAIDQKHLIVIWGAASFLFLGEETSWFQHLLQYSTPELVKSLNVQGEMNLHNLNFWNAPTWFASLTKNSFDLRILFSSANLFRIAFTAYFLIVPLFCHTFSKCSRLRRLYFILPDNFFLISVWSSIVLSIIMSFYGSADRLKALSETREMIYSLAILFYVTFYLKPER